MIEIDDEKRCRISGRPEMVTCCVSKIAVRWRDEVQLF